MPPEELQQLRKLVLDDMVETCRRVLVGELLTTATSKTDPSKVLHPVEAMRVSLFAVMSVIGPLRCCWVSCTKSAVSYRAIGEEDWTMELPCSWEVRKRKVACIMRAPVASSHIQGAAEKGRRPLAVWVLVVPEMQWVLNTA